MSNIILVTLPRQKGLHAVLYLKHCQCQCLHILQTLAEVVVRGFNTY